MSLRGKKPTALARLKEVEIELASIYKTKDTLNEEKRLLENQLILPKITDKHLGKYFLKVDQFNKKERMLIHVREILSSYEYKGIKCQMTTNGTLTIDPNYRGHFSSIGKEVNKSVWKDMVNEADNLISKI